MSESSANPTVRPLKPLPKVTKLALLSCGLGNINQGVEVSTARLFDAIKDSPELNVRLFSGGSFPDATQIANLPRDLLLNSILKLASLVNKRRVWEFAYGIEQVTYAFGVIVPLAQWQPDVVWTKEAPLAHLLLTLRYLLRLKFKIVFANGCGFRPPTYEMFDYIQHLQSTSYDEALKYKLDPARMEVLSNVLPPIGTAVSREEARASFGFKPSDWVVISVAAWDRYRKRIDYVIEEVAAIQDENTKLLLCGHPQPDAGSLKALAKKRLGDKVQWHTLPKEEIPRALKAADVFVLASMGELFGGAGIEAVLAGLPVVMHPHGASRILTEHGFEATDLSKPGNLAKRLEQLRATPPDPQALSGLAASLRLNLSEATLTERFIKMINQIAIQE
jgi:glycosyltransferase involved in cell wall biosynthesis